MIYIATFCEDEWEVEPYDYTEREADAYCAGFLTGANQYGAGSVLAYLLPRDFDEIVRKESEARAAAVSVKYVYAKAKQERLAASAIAAKKGA